MELTFNEQLILVLVKDGVLAIVLAVVAFQINKGIEKFKSNEAMLLELKKQNMALQNTLLQDKRERRLNYIDAQLREFYYPIFYRLQKDDAIWRLSPQLSKKEGSLPAEANDIIERNYILKNHREIIDIIEQKSSLIEPDEELQEQLREYVKHIAVYETIRSVESLKSLNPIDFGSHYPKQFQVLIENKVKSLQNAYEMLLEKSTLE